VFIDDRADMYPVAVENDYATLQGGRVNAVAVLDRWNIQVVMWQKGGGLPDELQAIGGWRTVYTDRGWLVLVRDPTVPPHIPR
jgi:hypothetical protein